MRNIKKIGCLLSLMFFLASCGGGGSNSSDGVITDSSSNSNAPVLSPIGPQTILAGNLLEFTLSATDANQDNLMFVADGTVGPNMNPFGVSQPATFNMSTGLFQWTPTESFAGDYSVLFTVTDDSLESLTDTELVTISVQDDVALGASLYSTNCENCHGVEGRNGSQTLVAGAALISITEAIANVSQMRFLSSLNESEVSAIASYLATVP